MRPVYRWSHHLLKATDDVIERIVLEEADKANDSANSLLRSGLTWIARESCEFVALIP